MYNILYFQRAKGPSRNELNFFLPFSNLYLPTPQLNLNFYKTYTYPPHLNLNFFSKNAKPIKNTLSGKLMAKSTVKQYKR